MKRASLTGIMGVVLVALGIRAQGPSAPNTRKSENFIIYVAGNGLTGPSHRPGGKCPVEKESACAMARGAYAAYKSKLFDDFRNFVDYNEIDDGADPDVAASLATRLGNDARVLAVIGHSRSDTTARAAVGYESAQIPLLVPIATSTAVGYSLPWSFIPSPYDMAVHMKNVFRLIPNDRIGQAPSIRYIVDKLNDAYSLKGEAVLVDPFRNRQYAESLETELSHQLSPTTEIGRIRADCNDDTKLPLGCFEWGPKDSPSAQPPVSPELLIFAGTGQSAGRFLKECIISHKDTFKNLKYLILTDGAKNVDPGLVRPSADTGVVLLLTFPTKQIPDEKELIGTFAPLKSALVPRESQSFEEYGFSSMALIADALKQILDTNAKDPQVLISRKTLIEQLSRTDVWHGANGALFIFHQGENVHPDYGIYGAGANDKIADVEGRLCSTDKWKYDEKAQGLNYLCYVGFDEVNSQVRLP